MAITLKIDASDLSSRAADLYSVSLEAVAAAEIRAINKTLRWLNAQVRRGLAGELGLPQSKLKQRLFSTRASSSSVKGKFWLGAYSIALANFGRGRRSGTGYRVKKRFVEGGFRATMRSGHEGIFSRLTEQRLPLSEAKVDIAEQSSTLLDRLFDRAEVELLRRFKQELNFEMVKRMRRLDA